MEKIRLTKEQGNRIKIAYKINEIKQTDVAKMLNVPPMKFARLQSGYTKVSEKQLEDIADRLKITVDWILNGGDMEFDVPKDTLGKRLRYEIVKNYVTISQYAKEFGFDASNLSYICNDLTSPTSTMLIDIHDTLGISIDWLLMGDYQ